MKEAAIEAIERAGGPTKLAKQLGVTPNLVTHWKRTRIPAHYALQVSLITGVPAGELRPDVFRAA